MLVTFEVAFQALLPFLHRHCTDEAQKAETVLSAVIYTYIYFQLLSPTTSLTYIYMYLTIIHRARMGSESIAHLAFGLMGY